MRKWTLGEGKPKPRSKNESAMEFKIQTLAFLVCSGVLSLGLGWGFVPGQLVCTCWSPELSDGVDKGFILGAQAGHLSLKVAGLAKSQAALETEVLGSEACWQCGCHTLGMGRR